MSSKKVTVKLVYLKSAGQKVTLNLTGMAESEESEAWLESALLDIEMAVNENMELRMHLVADSHGEVASEAGRVTTRAEDEASDHARAGKAERSVPVFNFAIHEAPEGECVECGEGQEHENHDLRQPDSHIFIVYTVEVND